MHVACESKHDTRDDRGKWNHLRIIQTKPEQHTGKAQNKGTTKNSHIGHYTHNLESTNVSVQNKFHMQNNITYSTIYKYRTAPKLYTLETWFVLGI